MVDACYCCVEYEVTPGADEIAPCCDAGTKQAYDDFVAQTQAKPNPWYFTYQIPPITAATMVSLVRDSLANEAVHAIG